MEGIADYDLYLNSFSNKDDVIPQYYHDTVATPYAPESYYGRNPFYGGRVDPRLYEQKYPTNMNYEIDNKIDGDRILGFKSRALSLEKMNSLNTRINVILVLLFILVIICMVIFSFTIMNFVNNKINGNKRSLKQT